LHVENFGTWRDKEGRLIWGVNDFDEAGRLSYANDLVRLGVSATIAIGEHQLPCDHHDACDAILAGYQAALAAGGRPFVLAEEHRWLRDAALSKLRDPTVFWERIASASRVKNGVPKQVRAALSRALPVPSLAFRIVHRQAGLGSLGRRRYAAIADWQGGKVAREAKELRSSALYWFQGRNGGGPIQYEAIIGQAVRVADPCLSIQNNWLIRRLAPDCSRIELNSIPKAGDEFKLLKAMGWEIGNVHLGTDGAKRLVLRDLRNQPRKWLRQAVEKMTGQIMRDWRKWKS
jgi:hypothetical protein